MQDRNQIPEVTEDPVDHKAMFREKLQAIAIIVAVAVIAARALDWI